jgi:hypothetical protein
MKIENYISQLLYRYQCVTVPGFGAFLTEIQSAQLIENTNSFYPPKKLVSFTSLIKNNDGLLANHVAKSEKTSYESALNYIYFEVETWHAKLQEFGQFSIKNIGDFYLNTENKIVFEPLHQINYLTESFGLSTFKTQKVERAEVKTQEIIVVDEPVVVQKFVKETVVEDPVFVKKFVEEPVFVKKFDEIVVDEIVADEAVFVKKFVEETVADEKISEIIKVKETTAQTTPVPVVEIKKAKQINPYLKYAAVLLLAAGVETKYIIQLNNETVIEQNLLTQKRVQKKVYDKIQSATFLISNPLENVVVAKELKLNYHLIANSFHSKDNAKKESENLKSKGYKSTVLPINENGVYQVTFESYATFEEAKIYEKRMLSNDEKAWVLTLELK